MSFRLKSGFTFGGWLEHIISAENKNCLSNYNHFKINSTEFFLFQAFIASMQNASIANPNPSVGCVVVKNNNIISTGCTEQWGEKHAERCALENIPQQDLANSIIYITLEPCTHQGKQPPCIDLFYNKGIQKVVVGCIDPNPMVAGQGVEILTQLGIGELNTIFANEIMAWNYPFFIQQKHKKIFIALKWAQTLDGCLADDFNGWKWISGEKSRKYAHWLRQKYDAILVGIGTVLNDYPSLDVRDIPSKNKRNPIKIIYDPEGKIFACSVDQQNKLKEKTLKNSRKTILLIDKNKLNSIYAAGKNPWDKFLFNEDEFIICPLEKGLPISENILQCLEKINFVKIFGRPLQSIFVEGGPRLLSAFVNENSFNLIHLFIAPFFLGGHKNKLFSKETRALTENFAREVAKEVRYQIASKEFLGDDILIEIIKKDS